ncbi:MAG: histone deacetylase, partial [Spirochaetales bacterium]|nr:histone deacetylase [Spirochaetales bacterium]
MVLHDLTPRLPIAAYGIDIPITGSNEERTLDYLLSRDDISSRKGEWLRQERLTPLPREAIVRVHETAYADRLLAEPGQPSQSGLPIGMSELEIMRTFELLNPDGSYHRYSPDAAECSLCELRDQSLRHAAGTTVGAELSLDGDDGFCFYFGGGMHHGQYDFGEGFCPVNDRVIAVRALQARGRIETAWIIDVDAHKGDGTAALTRSDETIRTLSIHMAQGWPLDQPRDMPDGRLNPSYIPSDIDVPIEEGEESTYLPRLEAAMEELERRYSLPDFLLVVDGADPYERD